MQMNAIAISILIFLLFAATPAIAHAIDRNRYASELRRWRRVQQYGIRTVDHPLLSLVFEVVTEPEKPEPPSRAMIVLCRALGAILAIYFLLWSVTQ